MFLTFYLMVFPTPAPSSYAYTTVAEGTVGAWLGKAHPGAWAVEKNKGTGSVLCEAAAECQSSSCSHAVCMSTLRARRPPTVAHMSPNNYGWGPKINCPVSLIE